MGLKSCCACAEHIPNDAKKCKHCGTYQNFYQNEKMVAFVALVLSLLVSLISVSAHFVTSIKSLAQKKVAKVELDVVQTQSGVLSVLARNEGNIPAVITGGMLTNAIESGPSISFIIPVENPILLDAGKYQLIKLSPYGGVPEALESDQSNAFKCRVSLRIAQQGREQAFQTKEFACLPNKNMHDFLYEMKEYNKKKKNLRFEKGAVKSAL
jgi:hypothetical protein